MKRLPPAALGALIAASSLAAVGCGLDLTSVEGFIFPERSKQVVQFPAPTENLGPVWGHVVDSNGTLVIGAQVTNGAIYTFTGDGKAALVKDRQGRALVPLKGDFILDNLPAGPNTIEVRYDEVSSPVAVLVNATDSLSFDKPQNRGFGATEIGTVTLPIVLPTAGAREALRVSKAFPAELVGTLAVSTGSAGNRITYSTGSRVSFELRSGPTGLGAIVTGVTIEYQGENGKVVSSGSVSVDPTIVSKGSVARSGPTSIVSVDLNSTSIATDSSLAYTAKVGFLIKELENSGAAARTGLDANNSPVFKIIPIRLSK